MPVPFATRLHSAIRVTGSPICIGLDPNLQLLPDELKLKDPRNIVQALINVRLFCYHVLDAIADVVPVVKLQSAYFEQFYGLGVALYYEVVARAKSLGLLVIGDVKRGDIGATSQAYAAAHLAASPFVSVGEPVAATPDAITINPYLGLDTIEPFLDVCQQEGKGLFVLVRTSNPGSADLQDLRTETGDTFAETIATKLNAINPVDVDGDGDYGPLGAVVGATQPHTMASMRKRMPRSIFLLPGYGTQGATAEMTRAAFDSGGRGAIVSASRSVLYPKREPGEAWRAAVRRAAVAMRDDLATLR